MYKRQINLVKDGYEEAADNYRKQKDLHLLDLLIFKKWCSLLLPGPVLDLGCGSGYPVCQFFVDTPTSYYGIDLAEKQIQLAKQTYHQSQFKFYAREMLEFCGKGHDNTFGGLLALFSIFHLPRELHKPLFIEIKRILKPNAPILISLGENALEEEVTGWLGAKKMLWSNFSIEWYQESLSKLSFRRVNDYREEVQFNNEMEVNWYLLFINA
ncbi:MAG: class I SAM-dependent methyltransferase [Candidatus Heimdallarchaeota archaeon]|nr:class I SAM-dependent methyltransferase [Candidatus Heimdallarchaeota archaeon]